MNTPTVVNCQQCATAMAYRNWRTNEPWPGLRRRCSRELCLSCYHHNRRPRGHLAAVGSRGWRDAPDDAVVERLISGRRVKSCPAERREATARMTQLGMSVNTIARKLGVNARSVQRYRAQLHREKAAA